MAGIFDLPREEAQLLLQYRAGNRAAADVLAERQRQITAEGWTPQHDDVQSNGDMARAAACYALRAAGENDRAHDGWPWHDASWKPKDARRDLVRAAALILAEIERLDRLAACKTCEGTGIVRSDAPYLGEPCPACGPRPAAVEHPAETMTGITDEHRRALEWARRTSFQSVTCRYARLCASAYDIAQARADELFFAASPAPPNPETCCHWWIVEGIGAPKPDALCTRGCGLKYGERGEE